MFQLPFLDREPHEGRYYAKSGRRLLHDAVCGRAEDISVSARERLPDQYAGKTSIAITYFGAAYWAIGQHQAMVDSNSLLFFSPGDEFCDREIGLPVGRSAVLLTLSPEIADELDAGARSLSRHLAATKIAPATMRVRLLAQALLAQPSAAASRSILQSDELLLESCREAVRPQGVEDANGSRLLIGRAKEFLHGLSDDAAISLAEVADAVGCSPIYLTQSFQRSEGVPLYRYHLRLRLSRALFQLRTCSEITPLAFELGFSSHSHFTSAFRTAFGLSPSQYRALMQ
jgi:AraC family transcriptional regulator